MLAVVTVSSVPTYHSAHPYYFLPPLVKGDAFASVGHFCTEVHHAYVVEQEFCELRVQGVLTSWGTWER